jgi:hypothetical protein
VWYVPLASGTITLVAPTENGSFADVDALTSGLVAPLSESDLDLMRLHFGFVLGLAVPRDEVLCEPGSPRFEPGENLCGLALGLAYRERVAFDSGKLARALDELSDEDVAPAREIFALERAAKVLLVPDTDTQDK